MGKFNRHNRPNELVSLKIYNFNGIMPEYWFNTIKRMRTYIYACIVFMTFTGCQDTTKEEQMDDQKQTAEWPKDIGDNFSYASRINVSHKLSLDCGGQFLPVRNKMINEAEVIMSNSGSEQARLFNDSTILAYIYNGSNLELVDDSSSFYKIRMDYKNQILEGYIVKNYCGKNTIEPFTDMQVSLQSSNFIVNPELLPYCRVFVSEKFHNLLSSWTESKDPLNHLKSVLLETRTELIIYSLFVGGSSRELYNNSSRGSSDITHFFFCVENDYYLFDFSNHDVFFVYSSASLPQDIVNYSIEHDTLKFSTASNEIYQPDRREKLYPLDNKRAYTSRNGAVWILNDSIRLVDISHIADVLHIPEGQIGQDYFWCVLELYIQTILPKRKDTYLEHYLDLLY